MSLDEMLNMTMTIHRPTPTQGNTGEEINTYAPVATGVPCTAQRPRALQGDAGPGLANIGDRTVYCEIGVDVRELDVLELTGGPDAGQLLEVDGPPANLWDDHMELRCRFFLRSLTGGGS